MKFELNFNNYTHAVIGSLGQKFVPCVDITLSDRVWAMDGKGNKLFPFDCEPYIEITLKDWHCKFNESFIKERFIKQYPVDYTVVDMIGVINEEFLKQLYKRR